MAYEVELWEWEEKKRTRKDNVKTMSGGFSN